MTGETGANVLVVDDNEAIADTYAAFLADDHEVRTAYGGRAALEAVDPTVDVVLLDRRMPDLSGDEVLGEIDTAALDCRVVMLTAVDPGGDIVDMPFDAYVTKPVDREAVTTVVETMVARSAYDDELRQFLSLVSKKTALEAGRDGAELADSSEYSLLERRVEQKRAELGVATDALEGIFTGAVPDIDPETARGRSAGK